MEEKLNIVYKKIDELRPSGYNPKKCSPKQETDIEQSIKKFGLIDPIIVNVNEERKNIIVGGASKN
jgi:ParB-like chromosome segregation protein Spo0J